jgi:hypothetical protein
MKKIPVGKTIAETYRFTFLHIERVIGVIWLPVVLLTVGEYFVSGSYLTGSASALDSGDFAQQGPLLARLLGFELVGLVLVAMVGAAITREILAPLKRPLLLRFGLGGTELRLLGAFVGLYVLLIVFVMALALAGMLLGFLLNSVVPAGMGAAGGTKRAMGFAVLIGLVLSPLLVYAMLRLSFLVVPGAVMAGGFGIEKSWQTAKGNVWRIILISLAVALPLLAVYVGAQAAILGLDYFNPHLELIGDKAAQARHSAEQMRLLSERLPLLMGVKFLLAPFLYGTTFAAPAFAWRALTAAAPQQ